MFLNNAQKEKVVGFLNSKGISKSCNECHESNCIQITEKVTLQPIVGERTHVLPVITLICSNCGHIRSFDMSKLGLAVEVEVEEDKEFDIA